MSTIIYLDNNATTMTSPEALAAMEPYYKEKYANPSGIYGFAQEIKKDIEAARETTAKLINASPEEIIFTSGGTEADNMAIKGIAYANKEKGNHIITCATEHHAVLNTVKYLEKHGFTASYLPVDKYGTVDIEALKKAVTEKTILISIMYANNEIGTIAPVDEIGKIAAEKGIYFHTDAVQAAGKLPIDVKKTNISLLSASAHKFHGPKGVGFFYQKKGTRMHSLMQGGHHEKNRRAGTENTAGIIGMAKALEEAVFFMNSPEKKKIKELRDRLENAIAEKIPDIIVNGNPENRMDNTVNICFKYIEGESILVYLDFEGICASSGSACTSGSLEPSHVLLALGIPHKTAHGSIRFSLSKYTTEEEIDRVVSSLPAIIEKLRSVSPLWKERKK
ncbi:MAG TPA: cysteine desulfurase NifS [Firmicutes bacterium]|nr:cysteine desulfurase NifS [Bacillota bacterium]